MTSPFKTATVSVGLPEGERRYFHWRGHEVSRLENFSDTVFAFALTLLVVSTDVPRDFDALMAVLRGFPIFIGSFLFLVTIWYSHYLFYRRYGLHDPATVLINNALLLNVLFFVYPMKFLTLLGQPSASGRHTTLELWQFAVLFRVYAAGLGSIFLIFTLLYGRAWRLREALQLTPPERLATLWKLTGFGMTMLVSVVAILMTFRRETLVWVGGIYLLLVPARIISGAIFRRRIKRACESESAMQ